MPTAQLFAQPCCSGVNPTASSGNGTSADDDRMQVDSLKKGKRRGKSKNQHQRGNRTTNTSSADINTSKNCGKPGGGAYDNSAYRNTGKGKSKNTGEGKGKHMDVVETEQLQPSETASTVSYPSQGTSVVGELSCIPTWIIGVTLNSVSSTRRQAGAEHLLLDSGAQLHACPLTYPGQRYRYLILESTQQVEQDYNTTEDDC